MNSIQNCHGLALELGLQKRLKLPPAVATKKQYERLVALGLCDLDKSGIAELTFNGRGPSKRPV